MNFIKDGLAWLADERTAAAGEPILYCDGAESLPLNASLGQTDYLVTDANGVQTTFTSRDFLITAKTLLLAGKRSLPKAGHRIRWQSGCHTEVYEVLPPPGGQPYRTDPYAITLRIHTKLIATEPA